MARGLKRGYKYRDLEVQCIQCGKKLKTPQALSGHVQIVHGGGIAQFRRSARVKSTKVSGSVPLHPGREVEDMPGGDLQGDLQSEIDLMKLEIQKLRAEVELRKLRAAQVQPIPVPDMAQRLGLGPMSPEISSALQSRAFHADGSNRSDGMERVIELLIEQNRALMERGVPNDSGGGDLNVLTKLGIDLADLVTARFASPQDVTVGPFDLRGVKLSEKGISSLIEYQAKKESSQAMREIFSEIAGALKGLSPAVVEGVLKKLIKQNESGVSSSVPLPPSESLFIQCPSCGVTVAIPSDTASGTEIQCSACQQISMLSFGEGDALPPASLEDEPENPLPQLDTEVSDDESGVSAGEQHPRGGKKGK